MQNEECQSRPAGRQALTPGEGRGGEEGTGGEGVQRQCIDCEEGKGRA